MRSERRALIESFVGAGADVDAVTALLDSDSRRLIETKVRRVEKVETAVEDAFQAHFVEAMALPHASDGFPELEKAVVLPSTDDSSATPSSSGRRRRQRTDSRARNRAH